MILYTVLRTVACRSCTCPLGACLTPHACRARPLSLRVAHDTWVVAESITTVTIYGDSKFKIMSVSTFFSLITR